MSTAWVIVVCALWAFVVLLALLVIGVLQRISPLLELVIARLTLLAEPPGLDPGTVVPTIEGLNGQAPGFPAVVLFLRGECGPCHALVQDLRESRQVDFDVPVIAVVDDSPPGRALVEGVPLNVLYQRNEEVSRLFKTAATPHAFAVGSDGRIVERLVPNSAARLRELAGAAQKGG
jgi:thiol-disulfide isomerase/thioredoxin